MDIRLGSRVFSSDGEEVGKVDRLVLDPETREIVEFIVHKGFLLTKDRIVEVGFVASVEEDLTVRLNLPVAEVKELPLFVEHSYIVPTSAEVRDLPYGIEGDVGASGQVMPMLWRTAYSGEGYHTVHRSLLEPVAVDQPQTIIESNISERLVSVDRGTEVRDCTGDEFGHVEDVEYDAEGQLSAIVVKTGLFRHHEYRATAEQIDAITGTEVRLKVSVPELEPIGESAEGA